MNYLVFSSCLANPNSFINCFSTVLLCDDGNEITNGVFVRMPLGTFHFCNEAKTDESFAAMRAPKMKSISVDKPFAAVSFHIRRENQPLNTTLPQNRSRNF